MQEATLVGRPNHKVGRPHVGVSRPQFWRKLVLIHTKVVLYVPIFVSRENRPIQAIKGGGETLSYATQFGEKKEMGRVHLRVIL